MKKEIYLITLLLLTLFSFINLWSAEEPETKRIKWERVLAEESEIKWKRWDRVVTFNKVEFYPSDSEPFSITQKENQFFIGAAHGKYVMIEEWDDNERIANRNYINVKIYKYDGEVIFEKNVSTIRQEGQTLSPISIGDNGVIIEQIDHSVVETFSSEGFEDRSSILFRVRLYFNEGKDIIDTDIITQRALIVDNPFADNFILLCFKYRLKSGNLGSGGGYMFGYPFDNTEIDCYLYSNDGFFLKHYRINRDYKISGEMEFINATTFKMWGRVYKGFMPTMESFSLPPKYFYLDINSDDVRIEEVKNEK